MEKSELNTIQKKYFSLLSFHLDNFEIDSNDFLLYDQLIDQEFPNDSSTSDEIKKSIRTYASMFMDFRIIKVKDDCK